MPQQDDPADELKEFLPTTEDFARVLDRKAADARTEETVRKAAHNANFASAIAALSEPVAEPPPRPVQASERVEYNPAKTVPPRTRRDTLEVQQKIQVAPELLDSRHRPTERIARIPLPLLTKGAEVAAASPSTPPAPGVSQDTPPPTSSEPQRRYLIPVLLGLLALVVVAIVFVVKDTPEGSHATAAGGPSAAPAPATAAAPRPFPSSRALEPAAETSTPEVPTETVATASAAPSVRPAGKPRPGASAHPDPGEPRLPKAVD